MGMAQVGARARRAWRLMAVVLVAVVATGCLSGKVDVEVDDDGAAHATVEVFPDSEVMRQISGLDVETLLGDPAGATDLELTRIDDDGREGFRLEFDVPDAAALGTALESGLTIGGQQVTLFSAFDLVEYDYGAWRLNATVAPAGQLLAAPTDQALAAQVETLAQQLRAPGSVGLRLTVSLPGTIISSNADRTSGGSATWELDDPDASPTLLMETEPAPRFTTAQLVALGGVLALVVGLALAAFGSANKDRGSGRRRRKTTFGGPGPATTSWGPPPGGAR